MMFGILNQLTPFCGVYATFIVHKSALTVSTDEFVIFMYVITCWGNFGGVFKLSKT